jgi:phenylalanine ammonia-lyase
MSTTNTTTTASPPVIMEGHGSPLEHASSVFKTWKTLQAAKARRSLTIDGQTLDIASVVAVARHGLTPTVRDDPDLRRRLQDSIDTLNLHLQNGWVIYGVNTGFGGSADSRTEQLRSLQVSLLQHTQSAIITTSDIDGRGIDGDGQSHVIPRAWVRGAILTRANQNLRGHSAVRLEVIEALLALLRHNITPVVPLRGTISASGDLMPLSYIAGTIAATPGVLARLPCGKVVPAAKALAAHGITPVDLAPKEGLGLINGTAPSAAAAALVDHEAQQLVLLSQLQTAFASECLAGNVEWSAPFIHAVRPHPGQIEAAANIRRFLRGSDLVAGLDRKKRIGRGLWQDRYSTRTAPQWIGPYLEDLLLARRQVETELNSTSDNPVVDSAADEVFSGGNFQATSLTSALEKTRLALQMVGRMLFSQCTELLNPALNNGLDPNLVFGDLDSSYTLKGIDVNMAAYMAELAALAHPVSSHVQSAEMHNQGINSLAFISARRTMEAVDVLTHMVACHAYTCCQAIDLRYYHRRFLAAVPLTSTLAPLAETLGLSDEQYTSLHEELRETLTQAWYDFNKTAHVPRCGQVAAVLASRVLSYAAKTGITAATIGHISAFESTLQRRMAAWVTDPANDPESAYPSLGQGAAVLYNLVRVHLDVPFHRGLREPEIRRTIGSDVGKIYEAIRSEKLIDLVMAEFADAWDTESASPAYQDKIRAKL